MDILIFTEGTIFVFLSGNKLSREKIISLSKETGIQREENNLSYKNNGLIPKVAKGSVYDFSSYVPINRAVKKITDWKKQGANIFYLTSRRTKNEIENIKGVLKDYHFPNHETVVFRQKGENYKDVVERLLPNIFIEDDCESIGGIKEMTYPNMSQDIKQKVHSVIVKEFEGIDELPTKINKLLNI